MNSNFGSYDDVAVRRLGGVGRWRLVQCLVRPVVVVVPDKLGQHRSRVAFVVDRHPIGALGTNGELSVSKGCRARTG